MAGQPESKRHLPKAALDAAASLAMLAASGALIWSVTAARPMTAPPPKAEREAPPLPKTPVSLTGAAVVGDPRARVGVLEFADFECPYCSKFARDVFPKLRQQYVDSGRVLFAYRHLPLESIHKNAMSASSASECAKVQDRFWQMHDALFRTPADLSSEGLNRTVTALKLDRQAFTACAANGPSPQILDDMRHADKLGISATPAFLVGKIDAQGQLVVTDRISGSRPVEYFAKVLEELLGGS
jgi:protein-disulfide isomerase